MINLPLKYETINNAGGNVTPILKAEIVETIIKLEQTTTVDWGNNSASSQIDFTPSPPTAGSVIIEGGQGGVWNKEADATEGRFQLQSTGFTYNDKIYYLGGYDGASRNDVWEYDPVTTTWTQKTSSTNFIFLSAQAQVGKYVYCYCDVSPTARLQRYDMSTDTWTTLTAPSFARLDATMVAYNNKLYVFGGEVATTVYANLYEYDITGDSWSTLTSAPIALSRSASFVDDQNGFMYVYGGITAGDVTDIFLRYTIGSDSWEQLSITTPPARERPAYTQYERRGYISGGDSQLTGTTYLNDLWHFSFDSVKWEQLNDNDSGSSLPHYGAGMSYYTDTLYIYAGSRSGDVSSSHFYSTFVGYKDTGFITTQTMDYGSTPLQKGEWVLGFNEPIGTSITFEAWASATGAFAGEEISLGTIEDGDLITELKRYYRVKATFTSDSTRIKSPILYHIIADFSESFTITDKLISDTPEFVPRILEVSSVSSGIDTFDKSTTGNINLTVPLNEQISEWLYNKYPLNKKVVVKAGWDVPGYTDSDFVPFFTGLVKDYGISKDDKSTIQIHENQSKWSAKVPNHWESIADDVVWNEVHPVDIIVDILLNHINLRASFLDSASFTAVKASTPTWIVSRKITGNTEDAETLLNELRILLSSFFIFKNDGTVKLKRYDPTETAVADIVDPVDIMGGLTWAGNTDSIINQINTHFGWGGSGSDDSDFESLFITADVTSNVNHDKNYLKVIKDKWVSSVGSFMIDDMNDKIIDRYSSPVSIVSFSLGRKFIALEAGDMISLTTPRAPSADFTGIVKEKYQITNKSYNLRKDLINFSFLKAA